MARVAHGVVTVQKPGGKPRRMPATHWEAPDATNYLKKAGYKLVSSVPAPVEAKPKPAKKPAKVVEESGEFEQIDYPDEA